MYVIFGVFVIIAIYCIYIYNTLIVLRNRKNDQFSQIDIVLKKRYDLIPSIINIVKGYANYEKDTLEKVIESRNNYLNTNSVKNKSKYNNEINEISTKLLMIQEKYPDLVANKNFSNLQDDLRKVENDIAINRRFYNDTCLTYNNKVSTFPSNIIARVFSFKIGDLFSISEDDRNSIKIDVGGKK